MPEMFDYIRCYINLAEAKAWLAKRQG